MKCYPTVKKSMQNKKSRQKTRVYAMEIVYQWLHTERDLNVFLERYASKHSVDQAYLDRIILGAFGKKGEIDEKVSQYLVDRALSEVTKIEYAILLIGGYELMFCYDVPYKVVINEAINLAKKYGADDSHKFVNSILDRIAKESRGMECQ